MNSEIAVVSAVMDRSKATLFFVNQLREMLMPNWASTLAIFTCLTAQNVIPETFSISLAREIKSR